MSATCNEDRSCNASNPRQPEDQALVKATSRPSGLTECCHHRKPCVLDLGSLELEGAVLICGCEAQGVESSSCKSKACQRPAVISAEQ